MKRTFWAFCAAVVVVVGSVLAWRAVHSAPATWDASDTRADRTLTRFTALVRPEACTSGREGQPRAPSVEMSAERVVVTFSVADSSFPLIGAESCQGVPGVAYEVVLPQPLGDRAVVDGRCLERLRDDRQGTDACRRIAAPSL